MHARESNRSAHLLLRARSLPPSTTGRALRFACELLRLRHDGWEKERQRVSLARRANSPPLAALFLSSARLFGRTGHVSPCWSQAARGRGSLGQLRGPLYSGRPAGRRAASELVTERLQRGRSIKGAGGKLRALQSVRPSASSQRARARTMRSICMQARSTILSARLAALSSRRSRLRARGKRASERAEQQQQL